MTILKDSVDVFIVHLSDPSPTDIGDGKTGLTFSSGDVHLQKGAASSLVATLPTIQEVDSTNSPGTYRVTTLAANNDTVGENLWHFSHADAVNAIVKREIVAATTDTIKTEVDAILVDTNELQSDWEDGGRLDLLLDTANSGGGGGASISEIEAALDQRLNSAQVTVVSPVATDSEITIIKGDDYSATDSRALQWSSATENQWANLTVGASVLFIAKRGSETLSKAGTVTSATGTQVLQVELTKTETDVSVGAWKYEVQVTLETNSRVFTPIQSTMRVLEDYAE